MKKITATPFETVFTTPSKPKKTHQTHQDLLDSPLSDKVKNSYRQAILKILSTDTLFQCTEFIEECMKSPALAEGIPEPLKSSLDTMIKMQERAENNSKLKPVLQTWIETYVESGALKEFSEALKKEDWSSKAILILSDIFDIEKNPDPVVRVRIDLGKIHWKVRNTDGRWMIPQKADQNGLQAWKESPEKTEKEPDDAVDLTPDDFIKFKRAGKRKTAYKYALDAKGNTFLERVRSDRRDLKRWDVGPYAQLPESKTEDRDHIPQARWLFLVQHQHDVTEQAYDALETLQKNNVTETTLRKHLKTFPNLQARNDIQTLFPIVTTQSFGQLLTSSGVHFRRSGAREQYQANLATVRITLTQTLVATYKTGLTGLEGQLTNAALTIAVPNAMHKFSRTFSLQGRVTDDRYASGVSRELNLDITHYCKHEQTQKFFQSEPDALEALGGFRYLFRQNLKAYNIQNADDYTRQQDKNFVTMLKGWKQSRLK